MKFSLRPINDLLLNIDNNVILLLLDANEQITIILLLSWHFVKIV